MKPNPTNPYKGWILIPPGEHARWFQIKDWLWAQSIFDYVTTMDGFLFEKEQDAIMFKLKWG